MSADASAPPKADAARPGEELPRMSFGDHLDELRKRLIKAMGAILLAVVCLLPFKEGVQDVIVGPYRSLWVQAYGEWIDHLEEEEAAGRLGDGEGQDSLGKEYLEFNRKNRDWILRGDYPHPDAVKTRGGFRLPYELVAVNGLQDFWTFMAASLVFALCIASPVVLWQVWAFIAAGLYSHERRVVHRHLPLAVVLLVSGILFGYFLVVPYGLYFLVKLMNVGQVTPLLSVSDYFTLLFAMTAALGAVFQLPLAMLAISKVGLMTFAGYKKHWRGIILGIWIIAALVTPPDPVTQLLMAAPLVLLFLFGLFLVRLSERKRKAVVVADPGGGAL